MRVLFAACGLAALVPADMFTGGTLVDIAGVAGGIALIGYEITQARRRRSAIVARPAE